MASRRQRMVWSIALAFMLVATEARPQANCPPLRRETVYVRGESMAGIFRPGEALTAEYGLYECHNVTRCDTVLVRRPGRQEPIVKSVLVLPGDRFTLEGSPAGASLLVNGQVLKTPHGGPYQFSGRAYKMLMLYVSSFRGVMPNDTYFVFGTHPNGSLDSSQFGPVTREKLVARVASPKALLSGEF